MSSTHTRNSRAFEFRSALRVGLQQTQPRWDSITTNLQGKWGSVRNTFLDIFPSFYFHQETVLCHHRAHTLYHYHRRAALSLPASSGTCSTMAPAALSEEIEPRNALDSERRKQDSRERRTRNTFDLAVSWPVPHLWRRMREWQAESGSCAGVALGLPLDTKGPVTTPFVATLHANWSLTYTCFRPKTFFSLFTD